MLISSSRIHLLLLASPNRLNRLLRTRRQRRLQRHWPLHHHLLHLAVGRNQFEGPRTDLDPGLRRWGHCHRPLDIRIQHHARAGQQDHPALAVARLLHGARCCRHRHYGDQAGAAGLDHSVYLWCDCRRRLLQRHVEEHQLADGCLDLHGLVHHAALRWSDLWFAHGYRLECSSMGNWYLDNPGPGQDLS